MNITKFVDIPKKHNKNFSIFSTPSGKSRKELGWRLVLAGGIWYNIQKKGRKSGFFDWYATGIVRFLVLRQNHRL